MFSIITNLFCLCRYVLLDILLGKENLSLIFLRLVRKKVDVRLFRNDRCTSAATSSTSLETSCRSDRSRRLY